MTNSTKSNLLFYPGLLFSIWFLITSWLFPYAMILSWAFGLIAYAFLKLGRQIEAGKGKFKVIESTLRIGFYITVTISSIALLSLIFFK